MIIAMVVNPDGSILGLLVSEADKPDNLGGEVAQALIAGGYKGTYQMVISACPLPTTLATALKDLVGFHLMTPPQEPKPETTADILGRMVSGKGGKVGQA